MPQINTETPYYFISVYKVLWLFTGKYFYCKFVLFNRKKCTLSNKGYWRSYFSGPFWLPVVGTLPVIKNLCKKHGSQHKALEALKQKYKTDILSLKFGKENYVIVFSQELIKEMLSHRDLQGRPDNFFLRMRTNGKRSGKCGYLYRRTTPAGNITDKTECGSLLNNVRIGYFNTIF